MTIKDIIDAERWISAGPAKSAHNACLDRIESAVSECVKNEWNDGYLKGCNRKQGSYEQRIAELETAKDNYKHMADQLRKTVDQSAVANEKLRLRIAELEAQVPKVVVPTPRLSAWSYNSNYKYDFNCSCGCNIIKPFLYCPNCGAKLDWSEA